MSAVTSQEESTFYRLENKSDNETTNVSRSGSTHNANKTVTQSNSTNENISQQDDAIKEDNEVMTIEERQIHESILIEREKAHAKLQATLDRVRETTRDILNEIDVFLESTENVMMDYTKCQNSQRNEARRLEEVEPDVVGATERYLQQVKGMV